MFDYDIYRADRNGNNSTLIKGGCVSIDVHKRFLSHLFPSYDLSCEKLSVIIIINGTDILLHSCHIPSNSSFEIYNIN